MPFPQDDSHTGSHKCRPLIEQTKGHQGPVTWPNRRFWYCPAMDRITNENVNYFASLFVVQNMKHRGKSILLNRHGMAPR